MRAEFYTNEGQPFMINGRHATIEIAAIEAADYLYIPTGPKDMKTGQFGPLIMNKFARLAVSTDGQVVLYALDKVREWERGIV